MLNLSQFLGCISSCGMGLAGGWHSRVYFSGVYVYVLSATCFWTDWDQHQSDLIRVALSSPGGTPRSVFTQNEPWLLAVIGKCTTIHSQSTVTVRDNSVHTSTPASSLSPLVLPKAAQEHSCHLSVAFISLLLPQPFCHPKSHGINSCWSHYSLNMYKGQCSLRRSSLVKHLSDSCLLHFSQVNTAHSLLEETLLKWNIWLYIQTFIRCLDPILSPFPPLQLLPYVFSQFSLPTSCGFCSLPTYKLMKKLLHGMGRGKLGRFKL